MSPVKYELGFYIPKDDILHSHRRENLKSYKDLFLSQNGSYSENHTIVKYTPGLS
jgi:hypothetical protein